MDLSDTNETATSNLRVPYNSVNSNHIERLDCNTILTFYETTDLSAFAVKTARSRIDNVGGPTSGFKVRFLSDEYTLKTDKRSTPFKLRYRFKDSTTAARDRKRSNNTLRSGSRDK